MTRNRVMHALFRAVAAKRPGKGLIHHSRSRQFRSHASLKLLCQFGMQVPMSRQGHCWNNAPMESGWGSLKTEPVPLRCYATREQVKCAVSEYIESFYNRIRKPARPDPREKSREKSGVGANFLGMTLALDAFRVNTAHFSHTKKRRRS